MMNSHGILSRYVEQALTQAEITRLDDGSFAGRIEGCPGVIAFHEDSELCLTELQSVLEEWIVLGLKMGHRLPVIGGIDLNKEPEHEPVDAL